MEDKEKPPGAEDHEADPDAPPVDGPGGDEGPGGLGSTSQDSPGEAGG